MTSIWTPLSRLFSQTPSPSHKSVDSRGRPSPVGLLYHRSRSPFSITPARLKPESKSRAYLGRNVGPFEDASTGLRPRGDGHGTEICYTYRFVPSSASLRTPTSLEGKKPGRSA